MESKLNKIDEVTQEVEFELPYSELKPHFEKAFRKFQKKAEIPGFRKGKAPINILKHKYGDLVEQSSLEDIANEIFRTYIIENNITPISKGQLIDISYEAGRLMQFKVKYEILPDIRITKYKGLEITKTVHKLSEESIDNEINYLLHKNATYESCEKATGRDFIITADLQEIDGKGLEIIGNINKNVEFYLNNQDLSEVLFKQLENITVGEERIISFTSDEGNTRRYKAHCTKIRKVILPELNKDFFSKIYSENIDTLDEFRDMVKKEIESFYKTLEEKELKNNIISELIRLNDITVPNSIIEKIIDSYIEEIMNHHKKNLPENFNEDEYRKTKRADAILEAKWYLIRDKIIELEKIEVTEEDIDLIISEDSRKFNIPLEKLKKLYKDNHQIRHRILDNKLINFLIENSVIKEIEDNKNT